METKIIVIGLNYNFNKNLAKAIADNLNWYFLDIVDAVNYNLQDRYKMAEKCGIEYMQKQENSVIRSLVDYEKTVINFSFNYFYRADMYKLFLNNSHIVYVRFSEQTLQTISDKREEDDKYTIDLISFCDRDKILKKICNLTISGTNKNTLNLAKQIILKFGENK